MGVDSPQIKGESMKRFLWLLLIVVFFSGCGTLKFPTLNAPNPPEQVYKYRQTINTEPRVVQTNSKGESVVFTAQQQTVDVNFDNKEKPLSWWQRFCNWLSSWSLLGVLALGLALFFAPAATIAWLWKVKDKFKKAFTQTVQAIDEANAVEKDANLKNALAKHQDASVKALVDDVQEPGK